MATRTTRITASAPSGGRSTRPHGGRASGSTRCTWATRQAATTARSSRSSGSTTTSTATPAPNVYKGMVGLMPIYDPKLDSGDETDPNGLRLPGPSHRQRRRLVRCRLRHSAGVLRLPAGRRRHAAQGLPQRQRRDAPGVVGQDVLPSLPQPRLRRRRLHRQRDGLPGDGGQAAQVPPAFLDASISRIYDLQLMRSSKGPQAARDLGYTGDELQGQYRLPGRHAVHEVRADRQRGRPAAQADRPRLVRAVAGEAPRVHRRLHASTWTARRPSRAT